ncbi:hypothetical protein PPERSA_12956 [Pseudocohnilembus persalinus]|uniref:Uncharacterized protein n=1 Tax=Pseudocohnilembus persalinus TaxID=266149 RepID=A0A0V0R1U8_PSEPJ|nr:hypothetical protein PPERSA_12956 [Pseudocohnilembus persalinus]|eukprot:KRX08475.1 hypothetical protein PPERSA_12956 [Pseudocohnilembus persalinus]
MIMHDGEMLSQRVYDHQTGHISVCRTNVEDEYFYVLGSNNLTFGFINARTGEVSRVDKAQLNSASGYSNPICALAGDKMYVLHNYGTPEWNTAVFVVDLSNKFSYTSSDVLTLDRGSVQTFKYSISGYDDGHAIVYAEKSNGSNELYQYIFDNTGDNYQQVKVENGLLSDINGQTKFAAHQDLKSNLSTILYGNTSKLQIFTYDSEGEEVCFKTLKNDDIKAFYKIEFGYIDSNTIVVGNTVSEERVFFLIDPQSCELKSKKVYSTGKVYGYFFPVLSENQEASLFLTTADSYEEKLKYTKLALGVVETEGCEDIQVFECLACDGESEFEYILNEQGLCEATANIEDEEDDDDKIDDDNNNNDDDDNDDVDDKEDDDDKSGSVDASIVKASFVVLAGLVSFVLI